MRCLARDCARPRSPLRQKSPACAPDKQWPVWEQRRAFHLNPGITEPRRKHAGNPGTGFTRVLPIDDALGPVRQMVAECAANRVDRSFVQGYSPPRRESIRAKKFSQTRFLSIHSTGRQNHHYHREHGGPHSQLWSIFFLCVSLCPLWLIFPGRFYFSGKTSSGHTRGNLLSRCEPRCIFDQRAARIKDQRVTAVQNFYRRERVQLCRQPLHACSILSQSCAESVARASVPASSWPRVMTSERLKSKWRTRAAATSKRRWYSRSSP